MKILFYKSASGRSPVEKFIQGLSKPDRGHFTEVYYGITAHGLDFERVEFRQLDGKLWEVKFKARDAGYRVAYVMVEQGTMVWLHAFKKDSQKAGREDLALAKKRMMEVRS